MASSHLDYCFHEGRKGKTGKQGPGILVVEGKYKFRYNQVNKAGNIFKLYCVKQLHPKFSCKAKAQVVKRDDGTFFLHSCDIDHTCLPDSALVIAEELKQRMVEIVRDNPANPVSEAIKTVKFEYAQENAEDPMFPEVMESLGNHRALEQKLLRSRWSIIGTMPKNRNDFNPEQFLKNVLKKSTMITIDSNNLDENWRSAIEKTNVNTSYNWDKFTDRMRAYEEEDDDEDQETGDSPEEQNDDEGDLDPKAGDLPKRVVCYTSLKLLKLFAQCTRGSLDGTFKSSCKLWKQQFVFMLKFRGHWIPVVWGWLPDKTELSYKVFLHLILEKLKDLEITFNLEEIICDFELAIHKSIDDICPDMKILGCFFHFALAVQRKVDKWGLKTHYENDEKFRRFVKQAIAVSALPLENIERGTRVLAANHVFDTEKENVFKDKLLNYIINYWVNGCYPPFIWSTWTRTDDYTNNNQEGFNSRMNKELKQKYPSPGILLCFLDKQIVGAEIDVTKATVGESRPRKQYKHRDKAEKRQKIKLDFQKSKLLAGADIDQV